MTLLVQSEINSVRSVVEFNFARVSTVIGRCCGSAEVNVIMGCSLIWNADRKNQFMMLLKGKARMLSLFHCLFYLN